MVKRIFPVPIYWLLCCLLSLVLILTACGDAGNNNSSATNTSTSTSQGSGEVKKGPQPCPELVNKSEYWEPIVPTQANINKVESITCAFLTGTSQLQALIGVRANGSGAALEVYVYDNIMQPNPDRLFSLQGLTHGKVQLSMYNSLLTAQVNTSKEGDLNREPDLFREFQWSSAIRGFIPVAFPGLFPDLTRFQAEEHQKQADSGQDSWRLDASKVASAFAAKLLSWPDNTPATLTSGGNANDLSAVATLKSPFVDTITVKVTMQRLSGLASKGIWIVTKAETENMAIDSPVNLDHMSAPVTVTGKRISGSGLSGTIVILDANYEKIGEAETQGSGDTAFSTKVDYHSTFKGGLQEGLVVLYMRNDGGNAAAIAVSKVLLQ